MIRARVLALLVAAIVAVSAGPPPASAAQAPPPGSCVGDSAAPDAAASGGLSPFERADVKAVAERITCYCGCPHLQVSKCFCGTAEEIRAAIASRLDAGQGPDEVVAAFMAEHGTGILAVPPRRGFNWIIWVGPVVLLAAGGLALAFAGRRWTRAPVAVAPVVAPEDEARHREQLQRLVEQDR